MNWIIAGALGLLALLSLFNMMIVLWRFGTFLVRRLPRIRRSSRPPAAIERGPPPPPLFPVAAQPRLTRTEADRPGQE